MFIRESKRVRHFVGRCERGEDLHVALLRLAVEHGIQAAWVQAVGWLESAELREYDQDERSHRTPTRFDTPLQLLNLSGTISSMDDRPFADLHVTLSRETDNGVQVLGGELARGAVFSVEFRLDAYDDLALVRTADAATGLPSFAASPAGRAHAHERTTGPELSRAAVRPAVEPVVERAPLRSRDDARRAPDPAPAPPQPSESRAPRGVTWAMAASASEEAQQAPLPSRVARPARREAEVSVPAHRPPPLHDSPADDTRAMLFDEPIPEVGEYLDHRQFGLCKIERMDEDGGVMLRMPDRRKKLIKLDVLQVLEPRIEGDRIIYPVRPRGPRKA
ncbi:MAG: PPC domain-containing DNA-binding protein [Polyangiales bacterium]|nr:DNA-binding protein [Myxococcales bacterium]MCB9661268.1 DNA-binding protein [Sandaracinaceae bacterium]